MSLYFECCNVFVGWEIHKRRALSLGYGYSKVEMRGWELPVTLLLSA